MAAIVRLLDRNFEYAAGALVGSLYVGGAAFSGLYVVPQSSWLPGVCPAYMSKLAVSCWAMGLDELLDRPAYWMHHVGTSLVQNLSVLPLDGLGLVSAQLRVTEVSSKCSVTPLLNVVLPRTHK